MRTWGCFAGWWGAWTGLVRRHRQGDEPGDASPAALNSETYASVVEQHTWDDAARDEGGSFGTPLAGLGTPLPGNMLSAFAFAPGFDGIENTDVAAMLAIVNARDMESRDDSPTCTYTRAWHAHFDFRSCLCKKLLMLQVSYLRTESVSLCVFVWGHRWGRAPREDMEDAFPWLAVRRRMGTIYRYFLPLVLQH